MVCVDCHDADGVIDRGEAGASAAREYERRKRQREASTRQEHPLIADALLALRRAPRHETSFLRGAKGEIDVADSLDQRVLAPAIVLHDRRMPRGRGNIDHLAIAPSGVFAIDTKHWTGKVTVTSPLLGEARLLIAGRDRTNLIDGLDRQVGAVVEALGPDADHAPAHGVLCFTKADLPLLGGTRIRGHRLVYRKGLAKLLNRQGPLEPAAIDSLARKLSREFPPA